MAKQKTKKQHYVPRGYLENWAIPNTYQVHVFDTHTKQPRKNSIYDIASERYFYDIDFSSVLSERDIIELGLSKEDLETIRDSQYVEKFFGEQIEGDFTELLTKTIYRARNYTKWEIENCYLISEEEKFDFSIYLALQMIRAKAVRTSMLDSADCTIQLLKEMGAPQTTIDKYQFSKSDAKFLHVQMILDLVQIEDIAKSLFSFVWVFALNRTKQMLYTSDNPIGRKAHIRDPFYPMTGLKSRGVEFFFPVSPDLLLVMFDGEYHRQHLPFERKMVEVSEIEKIDFYNSLCATQSSRCIFSTDGDFNLLHSLLLKDPHIFDSPSMTVTWGEKIFTPTKRS